jgi:DNA-binding MarR family transcriptional regulator
MEPIMSRDELRDKDFDLSNIDKVIHEPVRLSILAHLFVLDSADALFLKNQIGLTWGNFSTHLKRLEEAGYIQVQKEFVDRKPVTSYKLTEMGRKAFQNYREQMSGFFKELPG